MSHKERRENFYALLNAGRHMDAYKFLMRNIDIIEAMKVSELAGSYLQLKEKIPLIKSMRLERLLEEKIFNADKYNISIEEQ